MATYDQNGNAVSDYGLPSGGYGTNPLASLYGNGMGYGGGMQYGGNQPPLDYTGVANTSQSQVGPSLAYGAAAANMADPFASQRPQYMDALSKLVSDPGSQESSPYFKYLMQTQMNQVGANNAAGGFRNSGRGLMALQDRAAGVASQSYFPQLDALTKLAMTGSNPTAAAGAYTAGAGRAQDQALAASAARGMQGAQGQRQNSAISGGMAAPTAAMTTAPMPASTYGGGYSQPSTGGGGADFYGNAPGQGYIQNNTTGAGYSINGGQPAQYGGGLASYQPAYSPSGFDPNAAWANPGYDPNQYAQADYYGLGGT